MEIFKRVPKEKDQPETYQIEMKQLEDFMLGLHLNNNPESSKQDKFFNVRRLDLEFDSSKCKLIIMSDVTDSFLQQQLYAEKLKTKFFSQLNTCVTH